MVTTPGVFHCPHCGHSISGQEPPLRKLFFCTEHLESFAHLPINLREMLREGQCLWKELRPIAVLVAKMDHYVSLIGQHTVDVSNNLRLEIHARLLNRVLEAIIPIIDKEMALFLNSGLKASWYFGGYQCQKTILKKLFRQHWKYKGLC